MVETGVAIHGRPIGSGLRDLDFYAIVVFVDDLIVGKDHAERNRAQGSPRL